VTSAAVTPTPVAAAPADARSPAGLARATATVTAWNLVSRVTGFARVLAMGAALGATALGDTYQSANLVSNILFELLAGGMLSSVLVPTFVAMIDTGRRRDAAKLAGVVSVRAVAALGALVVAAMAGAPWIMRVLTVGVSDEAVRANEIDLGTFLLLFFLPQVVLYAVGAVATALLNADRRFAAAAVAPVFNNVVVIATMIAFRAMRGGETNLPIDTSEMLVLALGTTGGVLAMTLVPLIALRRAHIGVEPRWHSDLNLRGLAAKGMWAVGHLGLNQVLVAVTIVLAAQVSGGVVAYQIAFTFFLLPHALLAHPLFTTLYPRLAGDAARARLDDFTGDLGKGIRTTAFVLLPASALLAALAGPLLRVVRLGALDEAGAALVAGVLASYAVGLLGYSGFFLLTRASYALDDMRAPTVVNLWVTFGAVAGMVVASTAATGDARVIVLGYVNAAAVTLGSLLLLRHVQSPLPRPIGALVSVTRDIAVAVLAGLVAWGVAGAVAGTSRGASLAAMVAGGTAGAAVYVGAQTALRAPELSWMWRAVRRVFS
jgi:putative peptidoglycan lipid II flippase